LLVSLRYGLCSCRCSSSEGLDSPQALANRAEIEVNLDFVILYESHIPSLSGYLSAFSNRLTITFENSSWGLDYILSHHRRELIFSSP
jgi:hypothetical protein